MKKYMKYLLTGATVLTLSAGMSYGDVDSDIKTNLEQVYNIQDPKGIMDALNGVNEKDRDGVKEFISEILDAYSAYNNSKGIKVFKGARPQWIIDSINKVKGLNHSDLEDVLTYIKDNIHEFTFQDLASDTYVADALDNLKHRGLS